MLDVTLGETTGDHVTLRFRVTDTGIGIAQDKHWDIFGPFVQADASTTRRYGGTGLGLTISAQLVELMGGRLWIESELGKGSRFHFVANFGITGRRAGRVGRPGRRPSRPARALVDDNATNRLILSEILAAGTCRRWRSSGASMRWRRSATPRDGTALPSGPHRRADAGHRRLHARDEIAHDDQLATPRIILLTSAGLAPRGSAAPRFDAELTKPVKQSDLLDAIVTAFAVTGDRRRGRLSSAEAAPAGRRARSACSWRKTTRRTRSCCCAAQAARAPRHHRGQRAGGHRRAAAPSHSTWC